MASLSDAASDLNSEEKLAGSSRTLTESNQVLPLTKLQYVVMKKHYQDFLTNIEKDENLAELRVEFSHLFEKFCSNYSFQQMLVKKAREYESMLSVARSECLHLSGEIQEKNFRIKELEQQLGETTETTELYEGVDDRSIPQKAEPKTCKKHSNNEKLAAESETENRAQRLKLERINSSLKSKVQSLTKKKESLSKQLEEANQDIKTYEENLAAAVKEIKYKTKTLDDCYKSIADMKSKLYIEIETKEKLSKDLSKARISIEKLENEVDTLKNEYEKCQNNVDSLKGVVHSMDEENKAQDAKITALFNEKEQCYAELKKGKDRIQSLEADVTTLSKQKQAALKRKYTLETLKTEIEEREKLNTAEMSKLRKHIDSLEKSLSTNTNETNELRKQNEIAQFKLKKCHENISDLENTIKLKQEEIIALNEHLSTTNNKLQQQIIDAGDLMFEKEVLNKKIQALSNQLIERKRRIKLLEEETSGFQKEVIHLNQNLEKEKGQYLQVVEKKDKYIALHENLTRKLEEHRTRASELKLNIQRLMLLKRENEITIAQLKANQNKLNSINSSLRATIQKQLEAISNMKEEAIYRENCIKKHMNDISEKDNYIMQLRKRDEMIQRNIAMVTSKLKLRNQEVRMLNEKTDLLQLIIDRGTRAYAEKVSDIRLLKNELVLKTRKIFDLNNHLKHQQKLKKQVMFLQNDLNKEKIKTRGLEQQIQENTNLHHWRLIKGAEPEKYELINKNQLLRKEILKKIELLQCKDVQLRETEKQIQHLETLQGKKPDCEVQRQLLFFRTKCNSQKGQLESLKAQLLMSESYFTKYKAEIANLRDTIAGLRRAKSVKSKASEK